MSSKRVVWLFPFAVLLLAGVCQGADRDTAIALLNGVDALIAQGKHDKALKFCERALAADKSCPAVHMRMGKCHYQLGSTESAIKSYQEAERCARAEKDSRMARMAQAAINRVCPGLSDLHRADDALRKKLIVLADGALDEGHLETADESYALILARWPDHGGALSGRRRTREALAKRGDPVKKAIAGAMLSEIWYLVGIGEKSEARKMAQELSGKYFKLPAGQEAGKLLANNFKAPGKQDAVALKQKLITAHKKTKTRPTTTHTRPVASRPAAPIVDIVATEKAARSKAASLAKSGLASEFKKAFNLGLEHYRKAQPGTEGNQKNLALALEQFVRCESIYMRLDAEGVKDAETEKCQQKASMLRYACMKMTILNQ